MFKNLFCFLAAQILSFALASGAVLTLDEAISIGLNRSLPLQAASMDIAIKEADAFQVSLFANPELSVDVENAGCFKTRDNVPSYCFEIEQLVETAGKRSYRVQLATRDKEATEIIYHQKRHVLACDIEQMFISVANLQKVLDIAYRKQTIEDKMREAISEKLKSGKITFAERARNETRSKLLESEINRKNFVLKEARIELGHLIGLCPDEFDELCYPCEELDQIIYFEESPGKTFPIVLKNLEIESALQQISYEAAKKVPNFLVRVGVVQDDHFHKSSVYFGLSVPLPIFDRNQGGYARASFEAAKLEYEKQQLIRTVEKDIKQKLLALNHACIEIEHFRDEILTKAHEILLSADAYYQMGKIEYLEVLKEESIYLEIEEKYLEALTSYHNLKVEIKKILGSTMRCGT